MMRRRVASAMVLAAGGPHPEEAGDVVLEGVVAALVNRPGGLTVDGDSGIGHDAFELDEDGLGAPGRRRREGAFVDAVNARPSARGSWLAVFVDAEAL